MKRFGLGAVLLVTVGMSLACSGLGIELPPELEELLGDVAGDDGEDDTDNADDGDDGDTDDGEDADDTDAPGDDGDGEDDTDAPAEDGDGEEEGGDDADEPEPEPEPAPAPAPRPSGGQVTFTGANNVRLEKSGKKTRLPARLGSGTYKVMAQFDAGGGPVAAGEVTLPGSGSTTIACNARMRLCKVQ
ncbi:MAG: hypothetical protein ACI8PZ_000895 [Myxococcota bacterium]|jgi:hypothetical protein